MANIQTDVDRMINYLKENREADIDTLSRRLALPRNIMEGWLKVLEDENLVRLDYRLTKLYVTWLGEPLMPESEQEQFDVIEAKAPDERFVELEIAKETESENLSHTHAAQEQDMPLETSKRSLHAMKRISAEPETRKYYAARISASNLPESVGTVGKVDITNTKVTVPKSPNPKPGNWKPETGNPDMPAKPETVRKAVAKVEKLETRIPDTSERVPHGHGIIGGTEAGATKKSLLGAGRSNVSPEPEPQPATPPVHERKAAPKAYVGLSEKYKSYLELVNRQADELAKLREEKEGIYREGFLPLEKRFESELDVMTTKLLENEKKVLELYNRALSIPGRVVKLDGNMLTLREVEAEGERQLKEARESVLARTMEKKGMVAEELARLDALEREMQSGLEKVAGLEKVNASLLNIEQEIAQQIKQTSDMLELGRDRLGELTGALEGLNGIKAKVAGDARRIKSATAEGMEELHEIRDELKRFGRIEEGLAKRLEEHEKVIRDFREFVKGSESQYSDLREVVESQFVDSYTRELNGLLKGYEFEVNSLSEKDQKLDARIAESKRRLVRLISEAKGIISEAGKGTRPADGKLLEKLLDTSGNETIKNLKGKRE